MNSANNDYPPQLRSPEKIRAILHRKHILIFQRAHVRWTDTPTDVYRCDICKAPVTAQQALYEWRACTVEDTERLTYFLDGYCDVIAVQVAKEMVVKLLQALKDGDTGASDA